jgi:hypothetical protein
MSAIVDKRSVDTAIDIPILARGRVIMPGADAVEFAGRAGARFRSPDPHKHIHDLVLADAGRLSDLQAMPIDAIIDFLAALGPRLVTDGNPYLAQAFKLALGAGGLTEPVLRAVYDQLPGLFERRKLDGMIESTVGKAHLDGWVEKGSPGQSTIRVRAVGTRQLHITAGNVPVVAAYTVLRTALTKSDCLIKSPSNDPLTANAIVRTMIDMDPEHPVTKHFAVAYWKGGDDVMENAICRTSRIDKITAWGGMASMKHIQKYLVPGLDLVAMNPKLSISIVGKEALENDAAMFQVAQGLALAAGRLNQTACSSTRVVYVESGTDDASIARLIALGEKYCAALQTLPPYLSTAAPRPDRNLEGELEAIALEDDFYWVAGDTIKGGAIVSRFAGKVDFSDQLNNRIINLVPLADLTKLYEWCDDQTQTVPIYPERLREKMRDGLALRGVQRIVPLVVNIAREKATEEFDAPGLPHDGIEPLRRMVRWVIDQSSRPSGDAIALAGDS